MVGVASDTVTVASGCTATLDLTLTEPDSLQVAGTATGTSLPGGADGAIALNVTGGTPPYTYAWSNGATEPNLMDLPAGIYTVLVTDANGCVREAVDALLTVREMVALNFNEFFRYIVIF